MLIQCKLKGLNCYCWSQIVGKRRWTPVGLCFCSWVFWHDI